MNAYVDGIAALEQELAEIDRRRPLIERALVGLRELAGGAVPARGAAKTKAAKRGRTAQGSGQRAKRSLPSKSASASSSGDSRPRLDIVPARDAAVLAALKKGSASTNVLKDALPKEPGQTDEQRSSAISNALTRLKMKKMIKQVEHGEWALV